jgi:hypothetical protein
MPKGKRYILVEVDVEEQYGDVSNYPNRKLTDDSQRSFDSILAELERLSYADGTRVYGAIRVHEHNFPPETLQCLHETACKVSIGGLGKECDRPSMHHAQVQKHQYTTPLGAPVRRAH